MATLIELMLHKIEVSKTATRIRVRANGDTPPFAIHKPTASLDFKFNPSEGTLQVYSRNQEEENAIDETFTDQPSPENTAPENLNPNSFADNEHLDINDAKTVADAFRAINRALLYC